MSRPNQQLLAGLSISSVPTSGRSRSVWAKAIRDLGLSPSPIIKRALRNRNQVEPGDRAEIGRAMADKRQSKSTSASVT